MKILIFSDSHGQTQRMIEVIKSSPTVDYIIHLGDILQDAEYLQLKFPEIPVIKVSGNCDYAVGVEEMEKRMTIGGQRFFICHGHTRGRGLTAEGFTGLLFGNRDKDDENARAYDIILFGHTHKAYEGYNNGAYIINPGSISQPRDRKPGSYGIIEISEGKIFSEIRRVRGIQQN